ncbi:NIPSNAP family protein [Allorhodopirellula solitaria]|nr:NIPSNAP family protein [Allorhodopirellula solitaria]
MAVLTPPGRADEPQAGSQFYEVRTYELGDQGDEALLDSYLESALLPALERQQIGPIGVFSPSAADETGTQAVFVVIPYDQLEQIATLRDALASDEDYQAAAKEYLDRPHTNPPYERIRSELLSSMACWPELQVADGSLENDERVYELRLYESANERIGDLKVDMFNNGEVPIFLDVAITPVFIGQCLMGPQMPSLTYLTVYENDEARRQAWKDFLAHPDWKVLSKNPKYAGTVSHIDKFVLQAKPYSQM